MDAATFLVELIKATAWPVAVVFCFWSIKADVGTLISRTKTLTWNGKKVQASFHQELDAIEHIAPKPQKAFEAGPDSLAATLPPDYVINQAWLRLDHALSNSTETSEENEETSDLSATPLSPVEINAVSRLRELRNRAVHESPLSITQTDALRYRDLVNGLTRLIENRS